MGDSKESCGVNPKYLATALPGGISFEISPFGNQHHRVIGRIHVNALSTPLCGDLKEMDFFYFINFSHFGSLQRLGELRTDL